MGAKIHPIVLDVEELGQMQRGSSVYLAGDQTGHKPWSGCAFSQHATPA